MKVTGLAVTAALVLAVGGLAAWSQPASKPASTQPATAKEAKKSLYDRLGGADGIATVIDDFVPRVATNPVITANPQVAASLAKASVPGIKFKLTAQVCDVTGGPWKYAGRGMKEAHANLNISEAEWNAGVADLRASLDKFHVPTAEQDELIGLIATTRKDIVMPTDTK
ncbi:Group 1 truncated hemoglobin GlbN [Phycisphaerales bacterium]|nr:Group 1 truncated hemoglobin GlbN [Phycisphaerales bacterium]